MKTLIDRELKCEVQTTFQELNLKPGIQFSTQVGFRMGFTCFYEIQNNKYSIMH
jgi:hypothetical protein